MSGLLFDSNKAFYVLLLIYFFQACGNDQPRKPAHRPDIPKFHTQEKAGIWKNEAKSHIPLITNVGSYKINVRVNFPPTLDPPHYIEAIVLMQGENTQIAEKRFEPSTRWPVAEFTIPTYSDDYWVIAKCNLHDMWKAKVELSQIAP